MLIKKYERTIWDSKCKARENEFEIERTGHENDRQSKFTWWYTIRNSKPSEETIQWNNYKYWKIKSLVK